MEKRVKLNLLVSLVVVLLILIIAGIYLYYFHNNLCRDFECFQSEMKKCSKATYISEEPEASWLYTIKGLQGGECVVNVELIQAKKGDLGIDSLAGYGMDCSYPKGVATYPEKQIENCHGRLKEELQGVMIKKLHTYILQNLGKIDESLQSAL